MCWTPVLRSVYVNKKTGELTEVENCGCVANNCSWRKMYYEDDFQYEGEHYVKHIPLWFVKEHFVYIGRL